MELVRDGNGSKQSIHDWVEACSAQKENPARGPGFQED
tara:strand:+ start:1451 stop:1564 length:114 start_codon:yes stop_codon:yes gene_type:complete